MLRPSDDTSALKHVRLLLRGPVRCGFPVCEPGYATIHGMKPQAPPLPGSGLIESLLNRSSANPTSNS
eukprot:scaffold128710_cov37-Prasinocladus_malaysianus.AAC.1